MRVTDEMVERASCHVMIEGVVEFRDVRWALEAAVADVPDPSIDERLVAELRAEAAEYRRLWALCTDSRKRAFDHVDAAEARIAELEAKLAEETVRANQLKATLEEVHMWLDSKAVESAGHAELRSILGEP